MGKEKKTTTALDLIQIVTELMWERIYNNNVQTSILDHIYVDDMSAVETILVEKQPISDHSLVWVNISAGDTIFNKNLKKN
jgi:hypothetical protein